MTTAFNLSQVANYLNTSGQLNLATGVYGTLPQANGGTGATSLASVAVTSLTAGTGISLSASVGGVTITNTGGSGGASSPSSSTDVTLTNASNRVQAVNMTTYGKRVILPDATTITTLGGPLFIIVNTGAYSFDVCTTDGYVIQPLSAGQTVTVALSSAASANANWIVDSGLVDITSTQGVSSGLDASSQTSANVDTVYPNLISVSAISSTSVLIGYINRSNLDPYCVIATISGTTISYGTAVAVATASAAYIKVVALSSTAGIVAYNNGSAMGTAAVVISGTTITYSAVASSASTYIQGLCKLSSTSILQWYTTTAGQGVRVVLHNGSSALTVGTTAVLDGSVNNVPYAVGNQITVSLVDANKFISFLDPIGDGAFTQLAARVGTVSGTTITLGAQSSAATYGGNNIGFNQDINSYVYSTSECGCIFTSSTSINGGATLFSIPCTVTGTAVTFGTVQKVMDVFAASNTNELFPKITSFVQLDATNAIISFYNVDTKVYYLKYIPTVGWRVAGSTNNTTSPFVYSLTATSSTSGFAIGRPNVGVNGTTLDTVSIMYSELIKIPT